MKPLLEPTRRGSSSEDRVSPWLPRLAATVWLAWLGVVGLMIVFVIGDVPHPHFLPPSLLVFTLIVSGLALIGGAGWRLIRGRGRGRALTCLLLGVTPLWFMTAHVLYGLRAAYSRQVDRDLPLLMLIPFGESLLDLEARARYPQRTEGATVVMISAPVARSREQVRAMDRHVQEIGARLGRSPVGRVHWVRGPLFGMQGKAVFGLCMGSRPGEHPGDAEGLTSLDRHEVAHCVINGFCTVANDPPSVLSEGWAEANSGHDPVTLAFRALDHQNQGHALPLRELVGPQWYGRHHWPAYIQGAPLVNYLLRTYGAERFLTLYVTGRRPTFAQDCKRILGVTIDELDAAYQAEIVRLSGNGGSSARHRLERLRLGPEVDPVAWKHFLGDYFAQADRLLAPYDEVVMTTEFLYSNPGEHGKPKESRQQIHYARSGPRRAWRRTLENFSEAHLASPTQSFKANRKGKDGPWDVGIEPKLSPEAAYRRQLAAIDQRGFFSKMATMLLAISDDLSNRVDASIVTVTKLERITEDGHPCIRVRLEVPTPGDQNHWLSHTVVLAADDFLATRSDMIETGDGSTIRGEFAYNVENGLPVLRSYLRSSTSPKGDQFTTRATVLDRHFGPVSEAEFAPERLLDGPQIKRITKSSLSYNEPASFADWYPVSLLAGALSLAGGLATGFRRENRTGS